MIEQWPDEKLERCMIDDADLILSEYPDLETSAIHDAALHVKSLLARVRELENERAWLLRCEAAIKSMAAQFIHPKTTPEEMVDQILKGTP